MEYDIDFEWQGKKYTVGRRAYDANRIVLPDGTLLVAKSWLESLPPQPRDLYQITHHFSSTSEVVRQTGAELAREG